MKKSGFTLIELLVTISILAVLSTIGLLMYQSIQTKIRDGIRKRDLNNLATALEIYFQQHNGQYISGVTNCPTDTDTSSTFYTSIASNMSDGVVPQDPKTKAFYCYLSSNGQSYTLCANLENTSDPEKNNLCPTGYNYGLVPKI